MSFTFNGIYFDYIKIMKEFTIGTFAPVSLNQVSIPGRHGTRLLNRDIGVREITVPIFIQYEDWDDLAEIKKKMSRDLLGNTHKSFPLIFDIEPDHVFYANLSGYLDLDEHIGHAFGELTFTCTDPFRYALNESTNSTSTGTLNVWNDGAIDARGIVRVNFNTSASEYTITHQEQGLTCRIVFGFTSGNTLEIDMDKRTIRINGNLHQATFDWRSDMFALKPGDNTLISSQQNTSITHRNGWW